MNAPFTPRPAEAHGPRPMGPRHDPRPVHDARLLTGGQREADLLLDGMRYVLRITRQGKLILTK
jgi:hemin uptake protein HemP